MLVACRKVAIFCAFQASTNQTWNVRHAFHRRARSVLHVHLVLASFCRLARRLRTIQSRQMIKKITHYDDNNSKTLWRCR